MDKAAAASGHTRTSFINETIRVGVEAIMEEVALAEKHRSEPGAAPRSLLPSLKGEVKGILQWSEAELERFRATNFLSMMCESSDLLAKASRDRAAKEKGVRRRGLLARARWRERSAALARKVMKSENLAEDVYEYVRFQDADAALQRLHHNSSELEEFRLEGLAIEEVKRWLEYKDRALCQ
jgi:hypothetical protein